ncbi:MAG TPA: hypothetical protein VGM18_10050 [Candidatus Sulfotelmatobacter sp.]|jgi:hypothetical protein
MKKLAILMVLALELAVAGCGSTTPSTTTNTSTSGNWEAQLIGGTGEASKLNFITAFNVENSGPLSDITIGFINQGACFATPVTGPTTTETGSASFTTNTSTDQVTGALTFSITSDLSVNQLVLTSYPNGLTGTSNGTTTTTGTLSNGVVIGTWQLTGGAGDPSCANQSGTFLMCQGTNTCTAP